MKKIDTNQGYINKPKEIEGYTIERFYCECGCKTGYWHYVKDEVKNPDIPDTTNMNELVLRQMFKTMADCHADTRTLKEDRTMGDDEFIEGEVIQAMTEDRFIELLHQAKLLIMSNVVSQKDLLSAFVKDWYKDNPFVTEEKQLKMVEKFLEGI